MTAPLSYTKNALVLPYAVGTSVTAGEAVVLTTDTTIDDAAGVSDLAVGIAQSSSIVPGEIVDVVMFGYAVSPCLVGTGGATRGTKALLVADGFTDAAAHDSSGAVNSSVYGVFLQSGVATNRVGLLLTGCDSRGTA